MELGKKLKEARIQKGWTQERVAEALQVSRQTISNWETEKSYPDIKSVLLLSDLYAISLDALLKGDAKMLAHLEESTNIVKSNRKLILAFLMNVCLLLFLLVCNGLIAQNPIFIAGGAALGIASTCMLFYQIIKKI